MTIMKYPLLSLYSLQKTQACIPLSPSLMQNFCNLEWTDPMVSKKLKDSRKAKSNQTKSAF